MGSVFVFFGWKFLRATVTYICYRKTTCSADDPPGPRSKHMFIPNKENCAQASPKTKLCPMVVGRNPLHGIILIKPFFSLILDFQGVSVWSWILPRFFGALDIQKTVSLNFGMTGSQQNIPYVKHQSAGGMVPGRLGLGSILTVF